MCQARVSMCWGNGKEVVKTLAQGAACSEKVAPATVNHGLARGSEGLGSRMGWRLGLGKVSLA